MTEPATGTLPPQTHTQSIDERANQGRALRDHLRRRDQGEWKAHKSRRDPIEILIEQGESRLPNLLPLRYFLVILRSIFLKGVGMEALWPQAAALAACGVVLLALAIARSTKRTT